MQVTYHAYHLHSQLAFVRVTEVGLSAMQKVEQSTFFDQLHGEQEVWRSHNGTNEKHDVWVSVFRQHLDLVVELVQQLLVYFWVEYLFNCHFQLEIPAFVDCTETTH